MASSPDSASSGISTKNMVTATEMKDMFFQLITELRKPVAQSTSQVILPGAPGALCFKGKNITRYLQEWDDRSSDWLWNDEKKVERFPQYTDSNMDWLQNVTETLPGYRDRNWEVYRDNLKTKFRDTDERVYTLH